MAMCNDHAGRDAMDELQVFSSPDFGDIRTMIIDGEAWFVGKDVAAALGYAKPENALSAHIDEEDKTTTLIQGTGSNYKSKTILINESGLYSLILSSKLPSARKFKRWVTSEVLPTLRKTGRYNIVTAPAPAEQRILTTDDYLKAASIVAACRSERLPYVMHYLTRGGFDAPQIADADRSRADSAQAIRMIRDVKATYGMSNAQIGRIVGLDRTQVSCYANGQRGMSAQRAARIVQQLTDALAQMQGVQ